MLPLLWHFFSFPDFASYLVEYPVKIRRGLGIVKYFDRGGISVTVSKTAIELCIKSYNVHL